ncbi:hypothetical protein [Paraburkholderia bannensis]|nr:hypothetical protein [Paraburkholderia bannensis]
MTEIAMIDGGAVEPFVGSIDAAHVRPLKMKTPACGQHAGVFFSS